MNGVEETMTVAALNGLSAVEAETVFLRCCGSTAWARAMTAARPFRDAAHLAVEADAIWRSLGPPDWLDAFAAHPRIGESASREQSGMDAATGAVRQRIAQGNRDYESRFGFIYIVCAPGKTAVEMLAILEERLNHSRDEELRIAAGEQARITELRLAELVE